MRRRPCARPDDNTDDCCFPSLLFTSSARELQQPVATLVTLTTLGRSQRSSPSKQLPRRLLDPSHHLYELRISTSVRASSSSSAVHTYISPSRLTVDCKCNGFIIVRTDGQSWSIPCLGVRASVRPRPDEPQAQRSTAEWSKSVSWLECSHDSCNATNVFVSWRGPPSPLAARRFPSDAAATRVESSRVESR